MASMHEISTLLNGTLFQRDASMVKGSFAGFCREIRKH